MYKQGIQKLHSPSKPQEPNEIKLDEHFMILML